MKYGRYQEAEMYVGLLVGWLVGNAFYKVPLQSRGSPVTYMFGIKYKQFKQYKQYINSSLLNDN